MVDADEHFRRDIGGAEQGGLLRTGFRHQAPRAGANGLFGHAADGLGSGRAHHRSHHRLVLDRVADRPFRSLRHQRVDKAVVDGAVDIDALDRTAGLARIGVGAFGDLRHRGLKIGIGAHIGRVLAAEFEMHLGERPGGGGVHAPSAIDRADEIDRVEGAGSDQPFGVGMV